MTGGARQIGTERDDRHATAASGFPERLQVTIRVSTNEAARRLISEKPRSQPIGRAHRMSLPLVCSRSIVVPSSRSSSPMSSGYNDRLKPISYKGECGDKETEEPRSKWISKAKELAQWIKASKHTVVFTVSGRNAQQSHARCCFCRPHSFCSCSVFRGPAYRHRAAVRIMLTQQSRRLLLSACRPSICDIAVSAVYVQFPIFAVRRACGLWRSRARSANSTRASRQPSRRSHTTHWWRS